MIPFTSIRGNRKEEKHAKPISTGSFLFLFPALVGLLQDEKKK